MARNIVVLIFLVAVGVAGYSIYNQGKLPFVGASDASPEQQQLDALNARIDTATSQIQQADRAAGMAGMDTTADVESAFLELERIDKELAALAVKTLDQAVKDRCEELRARVRAARG